MLETPAYGQTVSGTVRFSGLLLTWPPSAIPTDGRTIDVWIDGVHVGSTDAVGAGFDFALDTTKICNGKHSILLTATGDAGNTMSFGARYFNIQNP
ncbi:MAG: hypothetical protein FJ280_16895 [Planctomycetes bacterium]|nr:hypothetical protein [Planctomycetota bacterium]